MTPADEGMAGLVGRLEAATGADRELDGWITCALDPTRQTIVGQKPGRFPRDPIYGTITQVMSEIGGKDGADYISAPPYTASIDAAMTLVEGGPDAWRRLTHQSMSVYSANPYNATAQKRFDGTARRLPSNCASQLCAPGSPRKSKPRNARHGRSPMDKPGDGWIEWQPIETAPRDGTVILTAYLHPNHGWVMKTAKQYIGQWWSNGSLVAHGVTHWVPLPKPPVTP